MTSILQHSQTMRPSYKASCCALDVLSIQQNRSSRPIAGSEGEWATPADEVCHHCKGEDYAEDWGPRTLLQCSCCQVVYITPVIPRTKVTARTATHTLGRPSTWH